MSHIIGRPNGDLLDVMLGHGSDDPEQAFIGGSQQGQNEDDGFEERLDRNEPTVPQPWGSALPACSGWSARRPASSRSA